jgi:hypothetical protein
MRRPLGREDEALESGGVGLQVGRELLGDAPGDGHRPPAGLCLRLADHNSAPDFRRRLGHAEIERTADEIPPPFIFSVTQGGLNRCSSLSTLAESASVAERWRRSMTNAHLRPRV